MIYPYVPEMIRSSDGGTDSKQRMTYQLHKKDDLSYCLDHLAELVSGSARRRGYGMLLARPRAARSGAFRARILAQPEST